MTIGDDYYFLSINGNPINFRFPSISTLASINSIQLIIISLPIPSIHLHFRMETNKLTMTECG